jgi:DNA-binding HxlR family transcriptional regulator
MINQPALHELCDVFSGDLSGMLSVTLRSPEADGLTGRKIYPEVPPKVEYSLTQSGHTLMPYLVTWAVENMQRSKTGLHGQKAC